MVNGGEELLGVVVDRACSDPSRLFYTPRRPVDGPEPETAHVKGSPIRFEELVAKAKKAKARKHQANGSAELDFNTAGPQYNGPGEHITFTDTTNGQEIDLTRWAAQYGNRFKIIDALRARSGGVLKGIPATSGEHIQCPRSDWHSSPSNEREAFAWNAGDGEGRGFGIFCQHDGCKVGTRGVDRLSHLEQMLTLGWLKTEDFTDDRFVLPEPAVESAFSGAPDPIGMSVLTGDPPPPPPVLVPGMIPMTVHSIVAPGGTAKSTIVLLCMILLIVGRAVFGKKPVERGPCLLVTAEDDLAIVKYRIRELCDAEELSDDERKLVAEQLYIEDVSGKPVRFAELDTRGNIVPSRHVDSLISKYKNAGIRWTVFDPAAFFSAGERFVNDGEAALMLAGRTISTGLSGAAVGFIHHTGQAAARDKIVDQYAGRGGSAFSDNSRATLVLAFHGGGDKEDGLYPPPSEVSQTDVDAGRVIRVHTAKFNAGRRETRPVWIVRREQDPFKFDFYEGVSNTPEDRATRKAATEKADDRPPLCSSGTIRATLMRRASGGARVSSRIAGSRISPAVLRAREPALGRSSRAP